MGSEEARVRMRAEQLRRGVGVPQAQERAHALIDIVINQQRREARAYLSASRKCVEIWRKPRQVVAKRREINANRPGREAKAINEALFRRNQISIDKREWHQNALQEMCGLISEAR